MAGLLGLLVVALVLPGCGRPEIQARWKDREIAIDGDYRDWEGALYQFENVGVYAGVLRDQTHLYVCVSSSDRARMWQVLRGGLTVWFDPTGKEARSFGLRFPVGGPPDSAGMRRPEPGSGIDLKQVLSQFTAADRQIEIRGGSSPPRRLFLAEATGIDAQIGPLEDVFTYELKIPLQARPEYAYAVHDAPMRELSIGLETGAQGLGAGQRGPRERPSDDGSPDGERPEGGPPGGRRTGGGSGGHRGGGHGGMGRGGGPPGGFDGGQHRRPSDPIALWLKVKLVGNQPK